MKAAALPAAVANVQPGVPRRFAVLGAGFGGVSVAWHLLQHTNPLAPVCVDLFDELGVGGGASGASGGLLHPYNSKGKLLWKGADGWTAALRLLAVAEATRISSTTGISSLGGRLGAAEPLAWRRGILRLARQEKHAITFQKNVKDQNDSSKINLLRGSEAGLLLPGLVLPEEASALHIPQAINIHPQRYLEALWVACEEFARHACMVGSPGTEAVFRRGKVNSLRDLTGDYEAVLVCLGAQAILLPELANKLPISLCRGVVAKLHAPPECSELYESGAPNLLSSTWVAAQGERNVLLGATKDWGSTNSSPSVSDEERSTALGKLFSETKLFYPSISKWEVEGMQAGLRAMPPRSALGSLPLVGCIDDLVQSSDIRVILGAPNNSSQSSKTKWWLLGGLGSRGLIHHAWLGEILAKAVILNNECLLPQELQQW
ncbi:unnamed protein product [Calypogeia fissa]